MRVLRLGTSDDLLPTVLDVERSYRLVEQVLAAETGEAVETLPREIWPEASLPDVIDRWLDRFQPEMVFLRVSSYWFTYQSVPLNLQRSRLGVPARLLARLGYASAGRSWPGNTAAFNAARNVARPLVGSAIYFTPESVIETVSVCIRRILQHERSILVVRGPLIAEVGGCRQTVQQQAERSRVKVDRALASLCGSLHVHYTGCRAAPPPESIAPYRGPDRLHLNALGHHLVGMEEAQAHVAAWRHAHGTDVPLYLESEAVC